MTTTSWPLRPGHHPGRRLFSVELSLVRAEQGNIATESQTMSVATSLGPNKAVAVACQQIGLLARRSIESGGVPWQVWDVRVTDQGAVDAISPDTLMDVWED